MSTISGEFFRIFYGVHSKFEKPDIGHLQAGVSVYGQIHAKGIGWIRGDLKD